MSELTVEVSKAINAPVAKVFNAWLNPEILSQFMTPGQGMSVPRCTADPVEGGKFEIIMLQGEKEMPHKGEYLSIKPTSEISFTWLSLHSIEGSVVTLSFTALSDTSTQLDLVHTKFPSEESRNNHEGGWTAIMGCLNTVLA